MALIEFTFGGGARTGVELGSLSISQSYGSRDSASFTIYSLDDTYSPAAGDDLGIFVDGTRIFGGKVLSVTRTMQQGTTRRANAVQASGYELLLDSQRVNTVEYVGQKLNDILRDLVNTYAAGDGIDLTSVPAGGGPTVTRVEFSDVRSVSDAITAACEQVSRKWVIDADKKLKTIDVTSGSSLYTIGTSSANVLANTFEVSESLEEYANRITLRMPNATTDLQTESFVGDGTTKQWTLVYPVASVPTVDVNGTAKTIGIDGVDTGKDFYWNAGSAVITQDSGASALTGAETLTVAYIGTALVSVTVNDTAQQAARAAIELTSGIYHSVRELTAVASAASATQLANALLTAAARPSFRAQWTNAGAGAEVIGSRVTINRLGISSTIFAIKEIRWDTISNEVRKTMVAFSGGVTRDGFEAFGEFSGGGGAGITNISLGDVGIAQPFIVDVY
jgi:hypothetical protein